MNTSQSILSVSDNIETAEILLPCSELTTTLDFYTTKLGFKVEAIFPADDPAVAVVSGYGIRLRLQIGINQSAGYLRLLCQNPKLLFDGQTKITAPNGTVIELVPAHPELVLPPLVHRFVYSPMLADAKWGVGRAGMYYRDLIPCRLNGRFIASHIKIEQGGEVADYPHFHNIRFQLIFCYKGWAKLVYEDQGEPFYLRAGDCVLQPPRIRHRVLESSDGLEVIEVGCPAEHETFADHGMNLPTGKVDSKRLFNGQRFVHHIAENASWHDWRIAGFECRDTGIASATDGLLGVNVVRPMPCASHNAVMLKHDAEFLFIFVLSGSFKLKRQNEAELNVSTGDSLVVPAQLFHSIVACSEDLSFLEIRVVDQFNITVKS